MKYIYLGCRWFWKRTEKNNIFLAMHRKKGTGNVIPYASFPVPLVIFHTLHWSVFSLLASNRYLFYSLVTSCCKINYYWKSLNIIIHMCITLIFFGSVNAFHWHVILILIPWRKFLHIRCMSWEHMKDHRSLRRIPFLWKRYTILLTVHYFYD